MDLVSEPFRHERRHVSAARPGTAGSGRGTTPSPSKDGRKRRAWPAFVAKLGLAIDAIVSSPYARAYASAEIMAQHLNMHDRLISDERVIPGFDLEELSDMLTRLSRRPGSDVRGPRTRLLQIVARLVGGRVVFKKGGMAYVECPESSLRGLRSFGWFNRPFWGSEMEIEAKFRAPDAVMLERLGEAADLAGYPIFAGRTEQLADTYLDTESWQILAAGYACRRRVVEGRILVSVKQVLGRTDVVHRREELEVDLPGDVPPSDWPDSEARTRVLGIIGDRPFKEMLTLSQMRSTRWVGTDRPSAGRDQSGRGALGAVGHRTSTRWKWSS